MAWNDERIEQLKTLWQEGLTASQVASRLGGGVSRNAVISKVHRLGLPTREGIPRGPRPGAFSRARVSRVRIPDAPVIAEAPIRLDDGGLVTPLTLGDRMCRWPIGDPTEHEFHFCGHKPRNGSPYCEAHARQAFQPLPRRGRAAARLKLFAN